MVAPAEAQSASEVNRELTGLLATAGRRLGFAVVLEYPVRGGRLDVVWTWMPPVEFPGLEPAVPVVGFEIESSWRTRKHVKGDLLNLQDAGVSLGVIVLAGDTQKDSRRSQHDVIDEIRARMETAAPGVVGLVVSMSGFSANVIERVGRSAGRPILLMDGHEVEEVVARGGGIYSLVRSKMDSLRRDRIATVGPSSLGSPGWLNDLPEAGLQIIDSEGRAQRWWESAGDFSQVVSSLVHPDPLWACEGAIRLDLVLGVRGADDMVELLKKLAQLGWISAEGTWRIEQAGVAWSGLGPAEFARQLTDWGPRYQGRTMHHSEVAMYVDESDAGMFTLSADLSASPDRLVRWCELSFMLGGMPLDPTPYQALSAEVPAMNTPAFRIVQDDPVRRMRLARPGKTRQVVPVGFLVRDDASRLDGNGESVRWVEGIIVADPTVRRRNVTAVGGGTPTEKVGHVFAQLRQHHHLGDEVTHELLWTSLVGSSHVSALHVLGDWDHPAGHRP